MAPLVMYQIGNKLNDVSVRLGAKVQKFHSTINQNACSITYSKMEHLAILLKNGAGEESIHDDVLGIDQGVRMVDVMR